MGMIQPVVVNSIPVSRTDINKCLGRLRSDEKLSWDSDIDMICKKTRRLRAKSILMYKILNDDTVLNLRNSFVRRNADQTDYHLRNSATELTLPKPKREFLKRSFK